LAALGFIELLLYFWHYQSAGKMQPGTGCTGILSGTDNYGVIKRNEDMKFHNRGQSQHAQKEKHG
jgi:hypothetical protein